MSAVLDSEIKRSPRLIELCLSSLPVQIAELREAISSGDVQVTRDAAHKLKGSFLAIGASTLGWLAEALQHQAEAQELQEAPEVLTEIEEQYIEVEKALRQELAVKQG